MATMRNFKLLLVHKFFIVFFFGFFITAGIILANLTIGSDLESNAVAINLSGNGRYRNYELYYLYDQLASSRNSAEQELLSKQIGSKTKELEKILLALRYGSDEFRLRQIGDKKIKNELDHVIREFTKDVKPLILNYDDKSANQAKLKTTIPHIVREINNIVTLYESASKGQVEFLQKIQIAFMAITFIVAIFIAFLLIYWIKRPIYEVIAGMKQLESGNLDYRFEEKRADEIGMLIKGYNLMASEIKSKTRKLEKLSQELKVLSVTDGLTGLYNHKHFYDVLENELIKAGRYEHTLSILFIDIDLFKNLNDRFGHKVGDEVLKQVAATLSGNVRKADAIFRYGGEEFAVILAETDKQNAYVLAEKLRKSIERLEVAAEEPIGKVTVSIGVASYPDDADEYNGLVVAADAALYKAKDAGRNRCVLYDKAGTK